LATTTRFVAERRLKAGASQLVQASLRDVDLPQYPYRGINPPGYHHCVAPRRLAAESILNAGFAVRSRLRKAHPKIQIFVIRFARRFRFVFMKAGHWTWRADNLFQDRATHPGE
jgi:hypothetical protein